MRIRDLWDKIGGYVMIFGIFLVSCAMTYIFYFTSYLLFSLFSPLYCIKTATIVSQRDVDVKICYQNKDTITYTVRFCDISDTTDILKMKIDDGNHNIPFTSIETYTILEKINTEKNKRRNQKIN